MPNHQDIERRAYELYEQRGRVDGRDWDDWLQAEGELQTGALPAASATSARSRAADAPRRRRAGIRASGGA